MYVHPIYLYICYDMHFKFWIYPSIYLQDYLSPSPLLCGPKHPSCLKKQILAVFFQCLLLFYLYICQRSGLFPFKADQTRSLGFLFDLKTFKSTAFAVWSSLMATLSLHLSIIFLSTVSLPFLGFEVVSIGSVSAILVDINKDPKSRPWLAGIIGMWPLLDNRRSSP